MMHALARTATMLCAALTCGAALAQDDAPPTAPTGPTQPPAAGLQVCNQSFDVVNVALAEPLPEGGFRTRGWWRIAPNQCVTPIESDLPARYVYAFATDVFGRAVLPGSVPMCIAPRRFVIDGIGDCAIRGFIEAPFHEIDTGNARHWTLFLAARPG